MQILKEKVAVRQLVKDFGIQGLITGFVPTMGALHTGHLSLIQTALDSCDKVIVSIFVNPTQFDNPNDLKNYPRTLEKDIKLLSEISKEIVLFSPNPTEVYEDGMVSEQFSFEGLEHEMEGKFRPGHFDGVATVIKKLFSIVKPDIAFFGEKDYQQLQVIRKLTEKEGWPIKIIGCPISREANGLARSSRNERLSPEQREESGVIYEVLNSVKHSFGTKSVSDIKDEVSKVFSNTPELKLEYFDIAHSDSLKSVIKKESGEKYRAFIAVYCGETRLIDNIALN